VNAAKRQHNQTTVAAFLRRNCGMRCLASTK